MTNQTAMKPRTRSVQRHPVRMLLWVGLLTAAASVLAQSESSGGGSETGTNSPPGAASAETGTASPPTRPPGAATATGNQSVSLDAYSIEVAVADRSPEEQGVAFQLAMRRVLLSNSGDKTLLNRDEVRAGLRDAESYVEQFRYRVPPAGTVITRNTPLTDRVRSTGQATQLMLVSFDRQRIRLLIDGNNTTSEPETQPDDPFAGVTSALVWLLIEDDQKDILIAGGTGANVMQRAREIAGGAGISLVFPTGDQADQAALTPDDLRSGNLERIRAASDRYAQPVILVAYLTRNRPRGWTGEWSKLAGDAVVDATFNSKSLDAALTDGVSWLDPELQAQTQASAATAGENTGATSPGAATRPSDTEALIWVSALNSVESYADMIQFFGSIPSVSAVYPKEINDRGMVFAVTPRRALTDVTAAAQGTSWLRRTAAPTDAQSSELGRLAELALDYSR